MREVRGCRRITVRRSDGSVSRLNKGTRRLRPTWGFFMPMVTGYLATMFRPTSGLAVLGHKAIRKRWNSAAFSLQKCPRAKAKKKKTGQTNREQRISGAHDVFTPPPPHPTQGEP